MSDYFLTKKYELSRGSIYEYLKQLKPAQLKLQPYYEAIMAYDAKPLITDPILKKIHLAGYNGSRSALRRFLEPYRANKKNQLVQTLVHRISRAQLIPIVFTFSKFIGKIS